MTHASFAEDKGGAVMIRAGIDTYTCKHKEVI